MAPSRGALRLVRAGLLGGLSLLLASGAHLGGGGTLPGAGVLLVAAGLLGLVAAVVTARRCRLRLLLVLLGAQQLLLHELFELAAAARACTVGPRGLANVAHVEHAVQAGLACGHGSATVTTMPMAALPGWGMGVAHLVATALTAWLLSRGEAWLWRLVDRVVVAAALGAAGSRRVRSTRTVVPLHRSAHAGRPRWRSATPRGPPLPAA